MTHIKTNRNIAIIEPIGGHGGMDYYCYGLAMGLGGNGIKVLYFTNDKTIVRNFKNVKTIYSFENIWRLNKVGKTLKLFIGYKRSFAFSKKNNISLVHLHLFDFTFSNVIIVLLAKIFSLKIVLTIHDINSFYNLSNKYFEKIILKISDGLIVHNNTSSNCLTEKHTYLKNKLAIIPHGNYLPFINRLEPNKNKNKILELLFFGHIKEVKGLDILLKGLSIARDRNLKIHLTVAGRLSKIKFDKYNALIKDLDLADHVTLILKYINDNEKYLLFKNAALVVLPYKAIWQSGVLLNAMSYGRATLVSNVPSFTEIVKDKLNGFIFESENPVSLANKLDEIYNNRILIETVVKNASNDINKKFDWISIGNTTLRFYNSILLKNVS